MAKPVELSMAAMMGKRKRNLGDPRRNRNEELETSEGGYK